MKEPSRLLSRGATDFERQLLRSVLGERPSPVLRSRMRQGLGLVGPLLWVSNVKAMFGNVATKLVTGKVALGAAVTGLVAAGAVAGGALGPLEEAPAPEPRQPAPAVSAAPAIAVEPALPALGVEAPIEGSELREEIALLDGARVALDERDHERAAELLSQHARRFGKAGALGREAQLLRSKYASSAAAAKRARRGAKEPRGGAREPR